MKRLLKFCVATILISISMANTSFISPGTNFEKSKGLVLRFEHGVENQMLVLDSVLYKNSLQQEYTLSRFRYYICNIRLKAVSGKEFISNGYYLVDEEVSLSKKLFLSDVPIGTYSEISFTLGVDSVRNCSGLQTGALDPAKGMFWAWNTGYIFLKLEGNSSHSKSPGHLLEYHIGGYKSPSNCIRNIQLRFPLTTFKTDKTVQILIRTDVSEILKNPTDIDFSKLSSVVDFHNSTTLADNYADLFSILKVEELP